MSSRKPRRWIAHLPLKQLEPMHAYYLCELGLVEYVALGLFHLTEQEMCATPREILLDEAESRWRTTYGRIRMPVLPDTTGEYRSCIVNVTPENQAEAILSIARGAMRFNG